MRRRLFYPRMAIQNVVKNRRFFYPFIMTCMVLSAMFYDLFFLLYDSGISDMRQIAAITSILGLGLIVIGIFALIFLLYSNGFLMKNRKRELGLYNILGMQKKNIAHLMLWEMFYSAFFGIFGGIVAGIALSKLVLLVLFKLLSFAPPMGFKVSVLGIFATAALFGAIMLVCLLYDVLRMRLTKPIELLRASSAGEREPKTKWVITLLGLLTIGIGYYIAITVRSPLKALSLFFVAVILVIIGTYCLFTSGSIAVLKALRRNKKYYYQPTHFTAVSGMLYRMKQNAAGLASICILSTMVLVVISTTVCLYTGVDGLLDTRYPSDVSLMLYLNEPDNVPEGVDKIISDAAEKNGVTLENRTACKTLTITGMLRGGELLFEHENGYLENEVAMLSVMTLSEYENLSGETASLKPGQALLYTDNAENVGDTFTVDGISYEITQLLDSMPYSGEYTGYMAGVYYLVVPDDADLMQIYDAQLAAYGDDGSRVRLIYRFDMKGEKEAEKQCFNDLCANLQPIRKADDSELYALTSDCRQISESDFMALYGGLFFVGLFLGVLFLMATALIIYYKQITEGYDDKRRFEIMQQVGMSLAEVKRTVRGQIITVFFLPLLAACCHLAFAFNMISQLLKMFELTNVRLFFTCCACTAVLFAAGYAVIYALTARTYYKIVRN